MNVRYEDMTEEQRARCDEILEKYTAWLNLMKDSDESDVTRDMYFEWDDPPVLMMDETAGYHLGALRLMAFSLSPFHDEGGHASLTVFYRNYVDDAFDMDMDCIVHEFDTTYDVIWQNGKFTTWEV